MNTLYFFLILSIIFYMIGTIPYMYHIFYGRVIPHPFSWTVWFLFSVVNGYILFQSVGYSPSLIIIGIRTWVLFIWSLLGWYYLRRIQIGTIDIVALVLAIMTIGMLHFFWLNQAVISMIVIDFLILCPTIKKIWIDPRSEDPIIWITSSLSFIFFILSLPSVDITKVLFWFYVVFENSLIALLIYRRKLYLSNWRHSIKRYIEYLAFKLKLW